MFIKKKFKEYERILLITKKPSRKEHSSIMIVSGLGIIIIGLMGFLVKSLITLIG